MGTCLNALGQVAGYDVIEKYIVVIQVGKWRSRYVEARQRRWDRKESWEKEQMEHQASENTKKNEKQLDWNTLCYILKFHYPSASHSSKTL